MTQLALIQAFPEFGFFIYRGEPLFHRADMLDRVRQTGGGLHEVEFCFAHRLGVNCALEPETPLNVMYRERALRLREEFDHLILMYSGGTDSHNILRTFLDNGIHLDEVQTRYPIALAERFHTEKPDASDPLSILFEYRHAAVPGLREVKQRSPRTKVTAVDTSDFYKHIDENWLDISLRYYRLNGGLFMAIHRYDEAVAHERITVDTMGGKRVGVIYGAEKPNLWVYRNKVYLIFHDTGRSGVDTFNFVGTPSYTPIMFYWGEPRITLKQGHVVKRAVESNPAAMAWVAAHDQTKFIPIHLLSGCPGLSSGLIYSTWDHRFQAGKHNDEAIAAALNPRIADLNRVKNRHVNSAFLRMNPADASKPRRPVIAFDSSHHCLGWLEPRSAAA